MKRFIRIGASMAAMAAALVVGTGADAPHVYAIKGARIVTGAGAPIASGNVIMRNGLIDAVGANAAIPPEAHVIEGAGLTVYPGLVDMGNATGLDTSTPTPPANMRTTEEAERFKRSVIFRPDLDVASVARGDSPELARLANGGITSVLSTPTGGVVKGQSALINVTGPVDEPQIGGVGDYRRGLQVVKAPVALHIEFAPGGGRGGGYPVSLIGVISFVRQHFIDAQHQQAAADRYAKTKTGLGRPAYDPALAALQPALQGKLPVAFEADAAREILRALAMAQ